MTIDQYNGKEINDDFGLGWNDYGARWYDATVGRCLLTWDTIKTSIRRAVSNMIR